MLTRKTFAVSLLAIAVSGCATLKPHPPADPPKAPFARLSPSDRMTDQSTRQGPPRYPYRSKQCTSRKHSQKTWGLTSKGLAVVAGGMAAAGALPLAALLVGASSAGLGIYADVTTADYVKSCTTGNAAAGSTPTNRKGDRQASDKPPPLTFSGVLTIVAGMLSAI